MIPLRTAQVAINVGRREFILVLGGAAVAWPLAASTQERSKLPTIGFLGTTAASAWMPWTAAFVDQLRGIGWVDGRTVRIEFRWADGRNDRFAEIATEFIRLKVDVIVTSGGAVLQTMKATSVIPIVFALASDPVASGYVQSLARPGGNVTGLSLESPNLAGKRLGLFREAVPNVRRLAVLANAGVPASVLEMGNVKAAAARLGYEFVSLEILRAEDIEPTFAGLRERADALYVCGADPLMNTNRVRINALALGEHLPTLHGEKQYVEDGGLMSYGPVIKELFKRTAELVDKILKGVKPADIPVEEPTKFELIVNLKTAKALGLTIPETFLSRADEVIE
jgi:putative tryptophan/tyrosine transport system substrate-binding protein